MGGVLAVMALYLLLTGFEAEVYRLKWRGEPTTLEELKKLRQPAGSLDVSDIVKRLGSTCERVQESLSEAQDLKFEELPLTSDNKNYPRRVERWDLLEVAEKYLAVYAEIFPIIDELAVVNPTIDYPDDWDEYLKDMVDIPFASVIKPVRIQTIVAMLHDDAKGATQSIERSKLLTMAMSHLPTVMGHFVREFNHLRMMSGCELILAMKGVERNDLRQWKEYIDARSNKDYLYWASVSERAYLIHCVRDPWKSDLGFFQCMMTRRALLRSANAWVDLSREDWTDLVAQATALMKSDSLMAKQSLLGNVYESAVERTLSVEAQSRLTSAGIASRLFQMDHGKVIGELGDLIPAYLKEVPTSPFNGEQATLTKTNQGELVFQFSTSIRINDGSAGEQQVAMFRYFPPAESPVPLGKPSPE
jgi:hypothetical protein